MKYGLLSLLVWLSGVAAAMDAAPPLERSRPPPGSEFQLFVENDMLAHTDRYYTNGIKLGLGLPFETIQVPAAWMLTKLAPRDDDDVHLGLFVGQNLYTPKSIVVSQPQLGDRPWAAWLYIGGVAQRVRGNRLDTVELDVGMVGPAALGREVQSNWHHLIGSPQPRGWSNQIPNEPAFLVAYLQKRKMAWGDWEFVPHAGATLGTVMTLARVGGTVRFGRNMTDFGPDTVEPGGAMLRTAHRAATSGNRYDWYVFAGVDQRLVARNIFLDGTVFRDSPSVERRRHVYETVVGLSMRFEHLHWSLTRIRRSDEFSSFLGSSGRQVYDSINLSWEF